MVDYAKQVANTAGEYQKKLDDEKKAKEEATHFDNLDEEAMLQL